MEQLLCWKSIQPEKNRYRYYSLTVDRDLWGELCLVRRWGRIWGGAREMYSWPATEAELDGIVKETHLNRLRHGYTLMQEGTELDEQSVID